MILKEHNHAARKKKKSCSSLKAYLLADISVEDQTSAFTCITEIINSLFNSIVMIEVISTMQPYKLRAHHNTNKAA